MNPFLGHNFEALDPLEWLARMSDHIPDPGQHRTLSYGEYSNRVSGAAHWPEPDTTTITAEPPPRRRCSPSWARLIAKVYQVGSLVCVRCGQRMSVLAFVTDQLSIRRIFDHLGLRVPEQNRPPPPREVLRVAEHGEGLGGGVGLTSAPVRRDACSQRDQEAAVPLADPIPDRPPLPCPPFRGLRLALRHTSPRVPPTTPLSAEAIAYGLASDDVVRFGRQLEGRNVPRSFKHCASSSAVIS